MITIAEIKNNVLRRAVLLALFIIVLPIACSVVIPCKAIYDAALAGWDSFLSEIPTPSRLADLFENAWADEATRVEIARGRRQSTIKRFLSRRGAK